MNDIPYSKLTLSLLVIVGWALIGISLRWLGLLKPSWDKAFASMRCMVPLPLPNTTKCDEEQYVGIESKFCYLPYYFVDFLR